MVKGTLVEEISPNGRVAVAARKRSGVLPLVVAGWVLGLCCGLYITNGRNIRAMLRPATADCSVNPNQNPDIPLKGLESGANRSEKKQEEPLDADGCYHVFIDAGANIGVHGRFLLEPDKYPRAKKARGVFDREFGEKRDNRDFCVFEIEPNPNHRKTLQEKSDAYKAVGWRYHILSVGVSDREGTMSFVHQGDERNSEWGFSVKNRGKSDRATSIDVPVIRLASWIENHISKRQIPTTPHKTYEKGPTVVMKVDIEGSEYIVLPDLMLSGAMCAIDFIFGEFHKNFAPLDFSHHRVPTTTRAELKVLGDAMTSVIPASRNCNTRFECIDDESYLHDGIPLPMPPV